MCVIIHKPKGVEIPLDILKKSFERNDDGWGMMRLAGHGTKKRVIVDRGLSDFDTFLKLYKGKYADYACAIHMRIKTHGEIDVANCHPYKIMDDVYLMHNGTISNAPTTNPKMSDTWHFVQLLKEVCNGDPTRLRNPQIQHLIHMAISTNRLLILDKEGFMTFNRSQGTEHEGAWYSNSVSLPSKPITGYSYNDGKEWCMEAGQHLKPDEAKAFRENYKLKKEAMVSLGFKFKETWTDGFTYNNNTRLYLERDKEQEFSLVWAQIEIKDGKAIVPQRYNKPESETTVTLTTTDTSEVEGEATPVAASKSSTQELTDGERQYVNSWQEEIATAMAAARGEGVQPGSVDEHLELSAETEQALADMDCHGAIALGPAVPVKQQGEAETLDAPFRPVSVRSVPKQIDGWLELTLPEIKEITYNEPDTVAFALHDAFERLDRNKNVSIDQLVMQAYDNPDTVAAALDSALAEIAEKGVTCV